MDSTTWILLYSKFSDSCKSLINMLRGSNLDVHFKLLCIDNKQIRSVVQKSKKFNIKSVPCILNIDRMSGIAGQYEGQKAFELVSSMIPEPRETEIEEEIVEVTPVVEEVADPIKPHSIEDFGRGAVIKSKISASQVMAGQRITDENAKQNVTSIENLEGIGPHVLPKIESKKTGKPINVSEIMAQAKSSGMA
jgi:hypothetical protein